MAFASRDICLSELADQDSYEVLLDCLNSKKWPKKALNEAMLSAAKVGSSRCFNLLSSSGASVGYKDDTDRNCLHYVLRYGKGDVEIIKSAIGDKLKKSPQSVAKNFINQKDKKGFLPIYYAAERGYTECVKELLKGGGSVDLPNAYDRDSPLMAACSKGHVDVALELIKAGSDVNKKNFFHYSSLLFAAQKGHTACARALLEHKADVNAYDYSGHSPLTRAAENGSVETVKLLVEHGADVSQTDGSGRSPLFLATAYQHKEAVEYLIEKGADVNQSNSIGLSPFLMAAKRDDLALVKLLIEHGCHVFQKYMEYGTAVHMCSISNSFGCLKYLLESEYGKELDLNEFDEKGKLPLTLACERLCSENVVTLLKHSADPNKLDLHGRTPLVCAIRGCRVYPWNGLNVIKAILRFGCDVNLKGKFDLSVITGQQCRSYSPDDLQSPLEIATRLGNCGTVRMMWVAGSRRAATATWCESNLKWYSVMECDVVISESAKNNILSYFEEISSTPRTLAECSRIAIRQCLGTNVPEKVNLLGLPEALRDYLNLPELDDIDTNYSSVRDDTDSDEEEILSDTDMTDTSESGTEIEMSDSQSD